MKRFVWCSHEIPSGRMCFLVKAKLFRGYHEYGQLPRVSGGGV